MVFKKIRIDVSDENVETLCNILLMQDVGGYELIDDKPVLNPYDGDYEELRPDIKDMGGMTSVIFYLEPDTDESVIIGQIQKALPSAKAFISDSDEADWRDKWKDFFHSFTIGDILIRPSWEKTEEEGRITIEIDPGISFGTGAHETTRMCIAALDKADICGKNILDAGCGSGILSIAAEKLGAGHITCVDIDPDCITTTKENILKNGCDESRFSYSCGDIISDEKFYKSIGDESFDIVVANILADIIIAMLPRLKAKVRPGGMIILSGIIEGKETKVSDALSQNGISIAEMKKDGEWYMIVGNL